MEKKTLGVIIDWIGNENSDLIIKIIQNYCIENSMNLVVFTLGSLSYNVNQDDLEIQLLPFLNSNTIDKLIIDSAQLIRNGGGEKLSRILKKAEKIPTICIEGEIDGFPVIVSRYFDAYLELLNHLWDDHGYRDFAWVGGPVDNPVSVERKYILIDFLEKKGVRLDPELDYIGDFNYSMGCDAGQYLQSISKNFDVVVVANDLMAFGVRNILGDNTPVVGFDNNITAKRTGLTTVDSGGEIIIHKALMELENIEIENINEDHSSVHSFGKFIKRSSCGCNSSTIYESFNEPKDNTKAHLVESFDEIYDCQDMSELAIYLNRVLPGVQINYWKFLPQSSKEESFIEIMKSNSVVIHSLFKDDEYYGFFVHDLSNENYELSDWIRNNIIRTFNNWQRNKQNFDTQKLLKYEIDNYTRRQKEIETVIDSLSVAIFEVDRAFNFRYVNKRIKSLLGFKEKQHPVGHVGTVICPEYKSRVENIFYSVLKDKNSRSLEICFMAKDKSKIRLLGEVSSLEKDDINNLTGLLGSFHGNKGLRFVGVDIKQILDGVVQPEDLLMKHVKFGKRESEVLTLLVKGHDTNNIAEILNVSPSTVRVQLRNIYIKTGVNNKKELIEFLAEYNSKVNKSYSLSQVLISRMFSDSK